MTRQKPWTEEEVGLLITIIKSYQGTQHWVQGQQKFAWGAAANELGRSQMSVYSKWSELRRKGIVKDE